MAEDVAAEATQPQNPTTGNSEGVTPEGNTTGDTAGEDLSVDDLKAALKAARKDAAKYRNQRNELRPLVEEYQKAQDAGKSEAERTAERIAALEAENHRMVVEHARARAAAAYDVPEDVVRGDTVEECDAHAKALHEFITKKVEDAVGKAVPYAPHVGGENTGGQPTGGQDWLRNYLLGN